MCKKLFFILLLFLAGHLLSADAPVPFLQDAKPPRKLRIGSTIQYRLTPQNTVIVIPEQSSKTVRFAGEELAKFLGKVFGHDVPIVTQPVPGKTSIILGFNRFTEKAGITEKDLVRDAFIIRSGGDCIYIAGRDDVRMDPALALRNSRAAGELYHEHATVFGVYEFLERFAGCRFYHANDLFTIIPARKSLDLPEIDLYERPDFEIRRILPFWGIHEDNAKEHGWSEMIFHSPQKAMNVMRYRLETYDIPCCHGLAALKLLERFGKNHPEYFALRSDNRRYNLSSMPYPGQLCYSSGITGEIEKDAAAILSGDIENVRKRSPLLAHGNELAMNQHTLGRYFNYMPQDGFYNCRCPSCLPYLNDPQKLNDFLWSKISETARKVKQNGCSGYVTAMAYPPMHLIPSGLNIEKADNILIQVAQTGPWDSPAVQAETRKRVLMFNRLLKYKVWMWNYTCKVPSRQNLCPGIPASTPWTIGKYYHSLSGLVNGAFMESETDYYFFNFLNYHVFGKLAWNNELDTDALLKEHFQLCYGPAAKEMETFFRTIEDLWMKKIGGHTMMTNLGPVSIPPSDSELWCRIYSPERMEMLTKLMDASEKLAKNDSAVLARIQYVRKNFFTPVQEKSQEFLLRNDSIRHFRVPFDEKHLAVLRLQPFKRFDGKYPSTTVTVSKNPTGLRVVFDCEEPEKDKIIVVDRKQDDEDMWRDNSVEIFLDPSGTRQSFYQFIINSKGCLSDLKATPNGAKAFPDRKWESGAAVRTEPTEKGFRLTIDIPWKNMGMVNQNGIIANFCRSRILSGQNAEYFTWSPFLTGFHNIDQFGMLLSREKGSDNLIHDADFSNGNWRAWGISCLRDDEGKIEYDYTQFVFGDKSAKIYSSGKKRDVGVAQSLKAIKPNTRYRVSCFVKCQDIIPVKRGGGVCIQICNSDKKNFFLPSPAICGSFPWIYRSFEITTCPDLKGPTSLLVAKILNASGTAWFDGITMEEIK